MKIETNYISDIGLWVAIDTDSYDGTFDSPTRFQIGNGLTEEEAIEDLKVILEG
jgi:hypothetical protein